MSDNTPETGITNRDPGEEKSGQDYVLDNVSRLEAEGERADLGTADRRSDLPDRQRERNLAPDNSQGDRDLARG